MFASNVLWGRIKTLWIRVFVILWKCGCGCVHVRFCIFSIIISFDCSHFQSSEWDISAVICWGGGGCCKKSLGLQHMSCTLRLSSILKLSCRSSLLKTTWSLKSTNASPDALVFLLQNSPLFPSQFSSFVFQRVFPSLTVLLLLCTATALLVVHVSLFVLFALSALPQQVTERLAERRH